MRYCPEWLYMCYRTDNFCGVFIKVPKRDEINTRFGVYQSACCGAEIVISEGTTFPDCPNHPHSRTTWTQIEVDVAEIILKKKSQSGPAA